MTAVADSWAPPVGASPKDVVWTSNRSALYRYHPRAGLRYPVPLPIVHSLISRPYIFDLVPGHSLVGHPLDQGFDVYLTDWGAPSPEDAHLRLEDYVLAYLPQVVECVRRESPTAELSILGYSLGGVLTLLYAAMHPDSPVRNIISLGTPVDFDHLGWIGAPPGAALRALGPAVDYWVATEGNIPAEWITSFFRMLRQVIPGYEALRYLDLWQHGNDPEYIAYFRALDWWARDHIPFPGAAFRQTITDLVRDNKLVRGGMELGGRPVDLRNVRQAFLLVAADSDFLVPRAATVGQFELVGSVDKQRLILRGGHVSLLVGPDARTRLWPRLVAWLGERSGRRTHEGRGPLPVPIADSSSRRTPHDGSVNLSAGPLPIVAGSLRPGPHDGGVAAAFPDASSHTPEALDIAAC